MIVMTGAPETDHLRLDAVITQRKYFTMCRFWLMDENYNTVAMANGELTKNPNIFELWDIEVRKDWRGQKLGKRILDAIARATNGKVVHTGGYTPEGLRSIAPIFHTTKEIEAERGQLFNSMTFVIDWIQRTTKIGD